MAHSTSRMSSNNPYPNTALPLPPFGRSQMAEQQPPPVPPAAAMPATDSAPEKKLNFHLLTPETFKTPGPKRKRTEATPPDALDPIPLTGLTDFNERLSMAALHIQQQQIREAVKAIRQAYSFFPGRLFIYHMTTGLDSALRLNTGAWVTAQVEDQDVRILQAIYMIKHVKYVEAKRLLQVVLVQQPRERLARLLFDFADEVSRRPPEGKFTIERKPAGT